MSREARGAALVVALFGLVLLALALRRRSDDVGAPSSPAESSEAAALAGAAADEAAVVATPADEQPGPPPGDSPPQARAGPPGPAPGAPGRSTLTLRGRVVDAAGRPVAGARVVCREAEPREVTSAADGGFACEGIAPGELGPRHGRVDLRVTGDAAFARCQGVVVGPDQPPVEVVLRPTARLRAKVLSSGAAVRLRGVLHAEGLRPRVEQAEGALDLECHEGDWVDVVAVAPGHAPRRFALRAPAPEVTVQLSRVGGGALRGRVIEHDGAPGRGLHLGVSSGAEDVEVAAGPASAGVVEERPLGGVEGRGTTRDDGSFTIDGLAEGTRVRLKVVRDDDWMGRRFANDGPGLTVEANVGDEELHVTLPRRGAYRARLRAVAGESGQPLADAGASLGFGHSPGEPGVLLVDLPGPGEHTLRVDTPTRLARSLKVTLDREETRDLGDLPLDLPGTLRVTLRWPEAPVEAVWLGWTDPRGGAERFDLVLPSAVRPVAVPCAPGSRGFTLRARRPGGLQQVVTFEATVVAGHETPVEVDLTTAPLARD